MQKAKITNNLPLTPDVFELTLETETSLNFQAGQFITIKIDDNVKPEYFRAYSICSAPQKNSNLFKLCIKAVPNGRGSNWLKSRKTGDEIEFLGPSGNFTFQSQTGKNILLIATGTGIAPLKAIIENELLNKKNDQQLYLLLGLRHIKDIFYKNEFKKLSKNYKNFKFDITLSKPENENWEGKIGRVTTILQNMAITQNTEIYLCGFSEMIEEVTKILTQKNILKNSIHFEKYN